MTSTESKDTRAEAEGEQPESAKFWLSEIDAAKNRERVWTKRADKVVARYRDERELDDRTERRTNILWSNTETLKSVLFQGIGSPDVRRRFPKKGRDERAAKTASIVLENAMSYCSDDYDADGQVACAVEDLLLPGRGQCWVVYDADVEDGDDGQILDQSVRFTHVYWKDYLTSAGRKEADIWWKSRRHQYSRDELQQYFPDHADKIPLDAEIADRPRSTKEEDDDTFKRSDVWEIWDKTKQQRVYIAEGYDLILKSDEDPYKLRNFFPCPEPIYGCKTTSSLVPIPEYTLYQDQAEELDQLTTRLSRLIDALKRRGVYDASMDGADNQLANLAYAGDNEFIPYKGFAQMMESGGLRGVFQTEDLAPIIQTVQGLYQQRQLLIQTIYEVTGISDVIRGASNPNETATAQRLKGQFGSLRIQSRQGKIQIFIRDLYRIKAEIIAEHYEREKLVEMTGVEMPLAIEIEQAKQTLQFMEQGQQQAQLPPPQQGQGQPQGGPEGVPPQPMPQLPPEKMAELERIAKAVAWEEVSKILRSDQRRGYKIDIETDTTVQADEQAEKESRMEFMTTMQALLQELIPAVQAMPELAPLAKELIGFGLKAFKVGRNLEDSFADAFDALGGAKPPQQEGPQSTPLEEAKTQQIMSSIKRDDERHQFELMTTKTEMQQKSQEAGFARQDQELDNKIKVVEAKANIEDQNRTSEIKLAEAVERALHRHRSEQQRYQH